MADESFQDDPSIRPQCALLRRIAESWLVFDGNTDRVRVSSAAFRQFKLSVHIGDDLQASGYKPADILVDRYPTHALAAITAGLARDHQQAVCRDDQEDQLCHGLAVGTKHTKRLFGATNERTDKIFALVASDNWVIPPSDALLERVRRNANQ
jgi:hypothetical protein